MSGGRILAVDFGSKNLGLAVSDPTGLIAQGLPTLKRTNRRADLVRLREIVEALGVERILVGHPVHLKGYAGERARQAARFADWLRRELRLPVELVDERLTSVEADNLLRARGASTSRPASEPPPAPPANRDALPLFPARLGSGSAARSCRRAGRAAAVAVPGIPGSKDRGHRAGPGPAGHRRAAG